MKEQFINAIYILIINITIITILTLINSKLTNWGLFLYLPGILFFSACKYLDFTKGMIISGISGFAIDNILGTPFGYHGILLPLFFIIGKNWLESTVNNKPWRPVIFQLLVNIILYLIWFLWVKLDKNLTINWPISRFFIDLIISSLLIIPLSFWIYDLTKIFVYTKKQENIIEERIL